MADRVRVSIYEQVALCAYVTEVDARRAAGSSSPIDSFRKLQLKQRRQAATDRMDSLITTDDSTKGIPESAAEDNVHEAAPALVLSGVEAVAEPTTLVDEFINDFVASDVTISNVEKLHGKQLDPHGVLSIPSKREGNSLTLCTFEQCHLLVVFGGRLLKDITQLLPNASAIDPLKLERVRYAFSNALYVYDIDSTTWELKLCTGRNPRERSDHSAVFLPPHHLLVFGGRGRNAQIFNDTFVLSLKRWHWSQLDTRTSPSERYWHAMCATDSSLFIFGGKSDVQVHGDLQLLDAERLSDQLLNDEAQGDAETDTSVAVPVFISALSWSTPLTIGKPPSARFGMRVVAMPHDQIAIVGGWRAKSNGSKHSSKPLKGRQLDMYLLDTATMVWTKPQQSSHVCALTTPSERFLFDCFNAWNTLIVTGGHTYATNGTTEVYEKCEDVNVIYKLDIRRMIWRRHVLSDEHASLFTPHAQHNSSSGVVITSPDCGESQHESRTRIVTATTSTEHLLLDLVAFDVVRAPRHAQSLSSS